VDFVDEVLRVPADRHQYHAAEPIWTPANLVTDQSSLPIRSQTAVCF
jgi:hypothetical protein